MSNYVVGKYEKIQEKCCIHYQQNISEYVLVLDRDRWKIDYSFEVPENMMY